MGTGGHSEGLPAWLRPRNVALFVAALLAVRLFVAASTGLVRDEGYYTLWSMWPALGYLDHPPMVAWLTAVGRTLLGESEAAVRLFPVLSTAVISLAVYRTGRLLFDARTAGLAVIWYNLTLAGGMLFVATPDAPVVTFWTLSVWAVAEFVKRGNANWWLLAGLFAGLALLSKYTAAFLGLGLLLYLVSSPGRRGWFMLWQVWAGALVALLTVLPNLWWNAEHGWAGVGFQAQRLDSIGLDLGGIAANLGDYFAGQALALGVVLLGFIGLGAGLFVARAKLPDRPNVALGLFTSLPILVFFLGYTLRFRVEANWPIPVWPTLTLVGAWAAVRFRPRPEWARGALTLVRRAQAPLGALVLAAVYAQALWQPLPLGDADRTRDMRGWQELERQVAELTREHRAGWVIVMPGDYGAVGQLTTYARFAGGRVPIEPMRDGQRYAFLPPLDPGLLDKPAILIAHSRTPVRALKRAFAEVEPLGIVTRRHGEEVIEPFGAFRVSGPLPRTTEALIER